MLVLAGLAIGGAAYGVSSAIAQPVHTDTAIMPTPPQTIRAQLIRRQPGTLAPGTSVADPKVGGARVFVDAQNGFGLAAVGQAQYPAASADGGRTWRTTGPALHVNAAPSSLSVTEVGAVSPTTYYYYGGGQVVDVTTDGGGHWWRAAVGQVVLAVVPGGHGSLVAVVQRQIDNMTQQALTWVYVSANGGRAWHYNNNLGAWYVPGPI
jgi:hypothetical protein